MLWISPFCLEVPEPCAQMSLLWGQPARNKEKVDLRGACVLSRFSQVWLFAIPCAAACQAPLSVGSPGKNTGVGCVPPSRGSSWPRDQTPISCCLLHWQADSLPLAALRKPFKRWLRIYFSLLRQTTNQHIFTKWSQYRQLINIHCKLENPGGQWLLAEPKWKARRDSFPKNLDKKLKFTLKSKMQ